MGDSLPGRRWRLCCAVAGISITTAAGVSCAESEAPQSANPTVAEVATTTTVKEPNITARGTTTSIPDTVEFEPAIVGSEVPWERGSFPDKTTGGPFVAPGAPDQLLEIGERQLVLAQVSVGAASWGLASWFRDDRKDWQQVNLEAQFDFPEEFLAPLGHGPSKFVSNGTVAVPVGSKSTRIDNHNSDSSPRVWTSSDLLTWELTEIEGAGTMFEVAALADGWAALGNVDGRIRVYVSEDAREWEETFSVDTLNVWDGALLARAGDRLIIDQLNDQRFVSDDSGHSWQYSGPSDSATRIIAAADGIAVEITPTEVRWSNDGHTWISLGAGTTPSLAAQYIDLVWSVNGATGVVGEDGMAELWLVTGDDVWIGSETMPWKRLDLSRVTVSNEWGGSWLKEIEVLADGTLMLLGGVDAEPGNKPMTQASFWVGPTETGGVMMTTAVGSNVDTKPPAGRGNCDSHDIGNIDAVEGFLVRVIGEEQPVLFTEGGLVDVPSSTVSLSPNLTVVSVVGDRLRTSDGTIDRDLPESTGPRSVAWMDDGLLVTYLRTETERRALFLSHNGKTVWDAAMPAEDGFDYASGISQSVSTGDTTYLITVQPEMIRGYAYYEIRVRPGEGRIEGPTLLPDDTSASFAPLIVDPTNGSLSVLANDASITSLDPEDGIERNPWDRPIREVIAQTGTQLLVTDHEGHYARVDLATSQVRDIQLPDECQLTRAWGLSHRL